MSSFTIKVTAVSMAVWSAEQDDDDDLLYQGRETLRVIYGQASDQQLQELLEFNLNLCPTQQRETSDTLDSYKAMRERAKDHDVWHKFYGTSRP